MSNRTKSAIQSAILALVYGLIIWHTVHWHSTGMHLKMFALVQTDKAYLTVLYNLGLMLVLGTTMGVLVEKTGYFLSRKTKNHSSQTAPL